MVLADDLSAIYYNPAGLARQRGTRLLYSHRLLHRDVEYRRARTLDWGEASHGVPQLLEFEHVQGESQWYLPGGILAAASDFGLEDFCFAVGVYGPPAVGYARYPEDGPQKYMVTEMDVVIIYYTLSMAWKHDELFGVGLSLQWVDVPTLNFEMVVDGNIAPRLVSPQESRFDIRTRIEGEDRVGFTAIVGAWYKPLPSLELALASRIIPIPINSESQLYLEAENLNLSEPISITKDGRPNNDVTFSMTLPVQFRAGVRYIHMSEGRELFDLELDLHYDLWSSMDGFRMDAGVDTELMGQQLVIDEIFIERSWRDTFSVRVGGDLNLLEDHLWLRGGFFYETPAVPDGYEYVDAFSFHRFGPGGGLTFRLYGADLSLAYTYIFQEARAVTEEDSRVYQQAPGSPCKAPYTDRNLCNEHYLGRPAAPANAGTYKVDYHLLNAGLSLKF